MDAISQTTFSRAFFNENVWILIEITYSFSNFNGCSVKVWKKNFVPHFIMSSYSLSCYTHIYINIMRLMHSYPLHNTCCTMLEACTCNFDTWTYKHVNCWSATWFIKIWSAILYDVICVKHLHEELCKKAGPRLNKKTVFPVISISIIKIRWSWDCVTFMMGIPIQIRHLYIETCHMSYSMVGTVPAHIYIYIHTYIYIYIYVYIICVCVCVCGCLCVWTGTWRFK